jgi:hypothetical protein
MPMPIAKFVVSWHEDGQPKQKEYYSEYHAVQKAMKTSGFISPYLRDVKRNVWRYLSEYKLGYGYAC